MQGLWRSIFEIFLVIWLTIHDMRLNVLIPGLLVLGVRGIDEGPLETEHQVSHDTYGPDIDFLVVCMLAAHLR